MPFIWPTTAHCVGQIRCQLPSGKTDLQRSASKCALPVVLELRYGGINGWRANHLLSDIQRQRDGLAASQKAIQRLTRRFKTGGQYFGVRGMHFQ
ncbi:Uncharacterised protein [Citrobacter freundii]|nr:Uncharacterised protein [Citrobacter freundii]